MILALNTSALQFGIAVVEGQGLILAEHYLSRGPKHFGGLVPAIKFLLDSSGIEPTGLECLAVAIGPGSFTGLRVGLATTKGLCQALNIPAVGVNTLEALAHQAARWGPKVVAMVHSRRDEVFGACFDTSDPENIRRLTEDCSLSFQELREIATNGALFVGNDYRLQAPHLKEIFGHSIPLAPPWCWALRASSIGILGLKRFHRGELDDPRELIPIYHRPPDIRPNPYPLRRAR